MWCTFFGWRMLSAGILAGLYYALDWEFLQTALRDILHWIFQTMGFAPIVSTFAAVPSLRICQREHAYTAECTYVDLLLMMAPFVWGAKRPLLVNLSRLAILGVIIECVNLLRTWAALYLDLQGVGRFYAHDLPDYVLWWPSLITAVLLAYRADSSRSNSSGSAEVYSAHPGDRA